jgi:hypothetical protein
MSRLPLGLAIRSAGILYMQAIQLAISQLILEYLLEDLQHTIILDHRIYGYKDHKKGNFDAIFNTLLEACELPKMNDAIHNYRRMQSIETNHSNMDCLSTNGMNKVDMNIKSILVATNKLLEAITILDLSESYKVTPLLSGDKVKTVLKNIPKGAMFGEVYMHIYIHIYTFICV